MKKIISLCLVLVTVIVGLVVFVTANESKKRLIQNIPADTIQAFEEVFSKDIDIDKLDSIKIEYNEDDGLPIVYTLQGDKYGVILRTKAIGKKIIPIYNSSTSESIMFYIPVGSEVEVVDGHPYYTDVRKIVYAGQGGYIKRSNIDW